MCVAFELLSEATMSIDLDFQCIDGANDLHSQKYQLPPPIYQPLFDQSLAKMAQLDNLT